MSHVEDRMIPLREISPKLGIVNFSMTMKISRNKEIKNSKNKGLIHPSGDQKTKNYRFYWTKISNKMMEFFVVASK